MIGERDIGREEVKLMEEQVRLRGNQMDKLEAIEKEEEERSRQVHDQAMQLQGAAELKAMAKAAKRELKKA